MAQPTAPSREAEPRGCLALIVRVLWMAAGNCALGLLAVLIFEAGSLSALDVVFWAIVAALVVIRYIDVTQLGGLTADGAPASIDHWRRYAGVLLGASGALWILAHAAGRVLAG